MKPLEVVNVSPSIVTFTLLPPSTGCFPSLCAHTSSARLWSRDLRVVWEDPKDAHRVSDPNRENPFVPHSNRCPQGSVILDPKLCLAGLYAEES